MVVSGSCSVLLKKATDEADATILPNVGIGRGVE